MLEQCYSTNLVSEMVIEKSVWGVDSTILFCAVVLSFESGLSQAESFCYHTLAFTI
jgi:hypothetical protein